MEYDGNMPREEAEKRALAIVVDNFRIEKLHNEMEATKGFHLFISSSFCLII